MRSPTSWAASASSTCIKTSATAYPLAALATRLVTLSNCARAVAQQLLARADLSSYFERLLSTEDAGVWKPEPGAYAYAATQRTTAPADKMLVAVHP